MGDISPTSEGVWRYTQFSVDVTATTLKSHLTQVSATLPATLTKIHDFPQYPYANFRTTASNWPPFQFCAAHSTLVILSPISFHTVRTDGSTVDNPRGDGRVWRGAGECLLSYCL